MKDLNQYVKESILDDEDEIENKNMVTPKTKGELQAMIKKALDAGETDLNFINTSKITDMSSLFEDITKDNVDVSDWDVSNVTDMSFMFEEMTDFNCDLSKWDVSNVTRMIGTFSGCRNLNCDLSKWDVSNVTGMSWMFCSCKSLDCDLNNWKINSAIERKTTRRMFLHTKYYDEDRLPKWYSNLS